LPDRRLHVHVCVAQPLDGTTREGVPAGPKRDNPAVN
jgi:hypothetical protein